MQRYTDYHQYAINEIQNVLGTIQWSSDADNQRKVYFNAGVILASKLHKYMFDPHNPLLQPWVDHDRYTKYMADQTYLNFLAQKSSATLFDIEFKFNHTNALPTAYNRFSSYFVHYAGTSHQNKNSLLKLGKRKKMFIDDTISSSQLLFKLIIRFNWLRQLLDKIF